MCVLDFLYVYIYILDIWIHVLNHDRNSDYEDLQSSKVQWIYHVYEICDIYIYEIYWTCALDISNTYVFAELYANHGIYIYYLTMYSINW